MENVKLAVLNQAGIIVSSSQAFQTFFQTEINDPSQKIQDILNFEIQNINHGKIDHFFSNIPLKQDKDRFVDFFIHSLKDDQDKILALIMTVIDQQKNRSDFDFDDENLCHLDRLTHIGKLSASIAHEIGNPLGGILAAAHGLKKKLSTETEKEYIDMIIDDIAAIKNTIESLRDFARRSKPHLVRSDMRDILKRTLFLVQPEIARKKIQFIENYPDKNLEIKADPEQLRQVFLNILLNAVAAVDNKGKITISVSPADRGNNKEYFLITIEDNGIGMSDEEIANIFKPFFTTKAKGLGLGLCVTKKIIEDHDGYLEVETQKGKGTTFKIFLLKEKTQ